MVDNTRTQFMEVSVDLSQKNRHVIKSFTKEVQEELGSARRALGEELYRTIKQDTIKTEPVYRDCKDTQMKNSILSNSSLKTHNARKTTQGSSWKDYRRNDIDRTNLVRFSCFLFVLVKIT